MNLEGLVEFIDDSALFQTHVPHDEYDQPLKEWTEGLLDPVRLITSNPRNYGFYNDQSQGRLAVMNRELVKAARKDKFVINFTQFYSLCLRITEVVYPAMYKEDSTFAFHKFLAEIILPLYSWTNLVGKSVKAGAERYRGLKRGTTDPLMQDERVLLLLNAYSPNLWLVFLNYARDTVGRAGDTSLGDKSGSKVATSFPFWAQMNEKGMFRLPPACPERLFRAVPLVGGAASTNAAQLSPAKTSDAGQGKAKTATSSKVFGSSRGTREAAKKAERGGKLLAAQQVTASNSSAQLQQNLQDSLFITESMFLRFATDFGLIPHLVTSKQCRDVFRRTNRKKTVLSSRGTTTLLTCAGVLRTGAPRLATVKSPKLGYATPAAVAATVPVVATAVDEDAAKDKDGGVGKDGYDSKEGLGFGLSFSEFAEAVGRLAVEGMDVATNPSYSALFPSAFSQVLALLTVWDVADLDTLLDVKEIHAEGVSADVE